MGRRTQYSFVSGELSDASVTDLSRPLRPPAASVPMVASAPDNYRNRNVANTTPIQLVGNAQSVRVLPANPRRSGLLIQNRDTTTALFVSFGSAADSTSLSIAAGGFILLDFTCPSSEVYAFATANIQALFIDMTRQP